MPVQFEPSAELSPPPGLSLSQLSLIHRHGNLSLMLFTKGERTPISSHVFPFSPPHYNICTLPSIPPPTLPPHSISTLFGPLSKCYAGQLTDPGKRNMHTLGQNLLSHYPHISTLPAQHIKVRSTGYNRTVESVRYLLAGMLTCNVVVEMQEGAGGIHDTMNEPVNVYVKQPATMSTGARPLTIEINHLASETMLQGSKCTRLESLITEWKEALPQPSTTAPLANLANGHSIYDAAVCARDNFGTVVEGVMELERACVGRWWDMYGDGRVSRLAMGRFVGEVADEIRKGTKLSVFSGYGYVEVGNDRHDSTIAPVLGAFGVFDRRFPPFGSIIGIEVWQSNDSKKFVRMHYNNKKVFFNEQDDSCKMIIPFCAEEGKHSTGDISLCTYDAFMQCVDTIVPKDYEAECKPLTTIKS